ASLFSASTRRAPSPTLFPYTTLFRSPYRIRHGDDGCGLHRGVGFEHRFHFARIDVVPAGLVHLLDAPDDPVASVGPLHRQVAGRSEEHTSELQSRENLVCRLLLEKKK